MDISFTTVVNTLFFNAIAIALLCFIIDRTRVVLGKNFRFFLFIIITIMLRLFVPCEILGVQNNVYLTRIYPDFYLFMTRPFSIFLGRKWSITSILVIVSLIGSIVCAIKFFLSYFGISRTLKRYRTAEDETIRRSVAVINRELGRNATFRVVQSEEIAAPFLFGQIHPVIALPEITLSEEEWYYILSHEMAHYYHRDLWLRFVCEVLHIVYWWNPFVYLLRKQLIVFQERHIDAVVTRSLDESRVLDYLSCLVKIAGSQFIVHSDNWIAEFNHKTELQDRIKRLLDLQGKRSLGKKYCAVNVLMVTLLIIFTLVLPNLVTLEPNGGIPLEEGEFILTPENAYLILTEEGKYEIYVDGEYKFTSSQILEDTLHIYNREGELIK